VNPMRVFLSPLTGRAYATRAYREDGDGRVVVTGVKHDVSADVEAIVEERLAAVEVLTAARVRQALHDAWLAVHVRRFDGDYERRGEERPEYAEQAAPDSIYHGTIRAERQIGNVAERYGIGYHELRDLRLPLAAPQTTPAAVAATETTEAGE
jgi:hypothetical protein